MLTAIFTRIMNIGVVQRQSMVSLFWQLALTAIGFASTMYFAHTVGASILGGYFLFMAYYSIFTMISDGGLGGAAIKRISEGDEQDSYFSAFLVIRSIFMVIAVLFLFMFRDYFMDINNSGLFGWLVLIIIVSIFGGAVSIGVAGRGKMGIRLTCNALTLMASIIFQVIAVLSGYGAEGLAGGMVAGLIVGSIIEYRYFDLHLAQFKWEHVKSLFVFAFWLFLTSGGVLVFSQADTVLIGYFLENSDVGIYRVVFQFTMAATFTTYALRAVLWPKVSSWGYYADVGRIEESLSRALSYSLLLAVPVLVGGVLLGDRLLYFFYGTDFVRGYTSLVILLVVQVVNVFQYFFTMYLDALNHPKESFKVTAVAATANIFLNVILIPIFGIVGAAAATLVSMTFNAFLARRALARILTIRIERDSLINILKASVIMGIFVGGYRVFVPLNNIWSTLLTVLAGGALFCILILKMDRKIYFDLREISNQMRFPWPDIFWKYR